jgi:hypothetical protein
MTLLSWDRRRFDSLTIGEPANGRVEAKTMDTRTASDIGSAVFSANGYLGSPAGFTAGFRLAPHAGTRLFGFGAAGSFQYSTRPTQTSSPNQGFPDSHTRSKQVM